MNPKRTVYKDIPNPYIALFAYTGLIVLGLVALRHAGLLFVPLFGGFVFAFLFNPLLHRLKRWTGFGRSLCSGIIVLTIFGLVTAILIPLIPYILGRITAAAEKLPQTLAQFSDKVEIFNQYLTRNFPDFVGKLDLMNQIERIIQSFLSDISTHFMDIFSNLYSTVFLLAYVILIPLFTYFILRDYHVIKTFAFSLVPDRLSGYFSNKLIEFYQILAAYIRGQAIVVIILSCFYSIGLTLIGFPFPVVIGIFSGLGDIIPYFGTVVGLTVSLIVGFVHFHSLEQMLLIMMVFLVIKVAENWFIYPKIVGVRVGLPFIWALLSFIAFGKLFGFWGLLVAIPISAGFKLFLVDVYRHYLVSKYYTSE